MGDTRVDHASGAARRRRERRLRAYLREPPHRPTGTEDCQSQGHERHVEGESELFDEDTAGLRPGPVLDPRPQERVQRHTVEQTIDVTPYVQMDIAVPKISLDCVPQCLVERRLPQMVGQLVDVPTVLSYALLQQRIAEQLVNTPRLGGRRFLGSLPGQVSTASVAEQTVDIPVPGRGGFHSDEQGFLPVHNPSAQSAEQIVDSSVPRGRGRRSQGFLPGQSSTASVAEQLVDISVLGGLPDYGRPQVFHPALVLEW